MELQPDEETPLFALSVAAGGSNLPDERRQEFAESHGVNMYMNLSLVAGKKWDKNVTNADIGKQLIEQYDTIKNYCPYCESPIMSVQHLADPLHASRVAAQQFRLNATVNKWEFVQQWEADHAPNREHRPTREVKVKLTYEWSNCPGERLYRFQRLVGAGRNIPLIQAKAELGRANFHFEFEYWNTNPSINEIYLFPTCTQEDGHLLHDFYQLPLQGHRHSMDFTFYSTTPGIKYNHLQVWVVLYPQGRNPIFYPIVCNIKIMWQDSSFDKAVQELVHQVPQKYKLVDGEIPVSSIPDSVDSPPMNQQRDGFVLERMYKPTSLNHNSLKPYFDAWLDQDDDMAKNKTGERVERELRLGDQPATSGKVLGIKNLVDMKVPLTKNNIGDRNQLEIIGQEQHEQDSSTRAPVSFMRYVWWNVDYPQGFDGNVDDTSVLLVHATVPKVDFKGLRSTDSSDNVRLMHKSWKVKYTATIIREEPHPDPSCVGLILKLNAAAKREVCPMLEIPPEAQATMEPCYLLPPTSLVTGYLTSLYRVINSNEQTEAEPIPTAEPIEDGATPAPATASVVAPKMSNKDWFNDNLRRRYKSINDRFFQEARTLLTELLPNLEIPPELKQYADQLDPGQRAVFDAVFRGERFVSCEAPPGSGKTFLIALLIVLLHLTDSEARILCVTPTNTASDVVGRKILSFMLEIVNHVPLKSLLRFVRPGYSVTELGPLFEYSSLGKSDLPMTDDPSVNASRIYEHKIQVQTIDLAIMNNLNTNKTSKANGDSIYKLVVVDEAACVDLPKLNVLMTLGESGQIVLLGDTRQLPAYVTSFKVKALGGDESGMAIANRQVKQNKNGVLLSLKHNYRSVKPIISPSNRIMYTDNPVLPVNDAQLHHEIEQQNIASGRMLRSHVLPGPTRCGVSFLHVEGVMKRHGCSYYNKDELFALHAIISLMIWMGIPQKDIGIDCTYAAQSALAKILLAHFPGVRIGCTNTWQGNERDYMIITLVQSLADQTADTYGMGQQSGFLEDLRRLNVAVTRARKGTIVIGNALHFLYHPLIVEILREVCTNGSWIDEPLRNAAGLNYDLNVPRYVTPWAVRYFVHLVVCECHPNPDVYANSSKSPTVAQALEDVDNHRCTTHSNRYIPVYGES